jgi:hypothetical protein
LQGKSSFFQKILFSHIVQILHANRIRSRSDPSLGVLKTVVNVLKSELHRRLQTVVSVLKSHLLHTSASSNRHCLHLLHTSASSNRHCLHRRLKTVVNVLKSEPTS